MSGTLQPIRPQPQLPPEVMQRLMGGAPPRPPGPPPGAGPGGPPPGGPGGMPPGPPQGPPPGPPPAMAGGAPPAGRMPVPMGPGGPPPGGPPPGAGPGGPPPNGANLAMFGRAAGAPPGVPGMSAAAGGNMGLQAHELAALGRFGDSIIAHLSPGELVIPREVQQMAPQAIHEIANVMAKHGISINQFVAGAKPASVNPNSGQQEFSIWSSLAGAILPIAGAAIGTMIAPGVGTAVGAGLGSAAGSAINGGNLAQDALAGLGGAVGGYFGGGAVGDLGAMGLSDAGSAASSGALDGLATGSLGIGDTIGSAAGGGGTGPLGSGLLSGGLGLGGSSGGGGGLGGLISSGATAGNPLPSAGAGGSGVLGGNSGGGGGLLAQLFGGGQNSGVVNSIAGNPYVKAGLGASLGSQLGYNLAAPTPVKPVANTTAPGFTDHMPAPGSLGTANQLLGNNRPMQPTFAGFNPYAAATGNGYNFFPAPG